MKTAYVAKTFAPAAAAALLLPAQASATPGLPSPLLGAGGCIASAAHPHKSKGEAAKGRHIMLAKVTAKCAGTTAPSRLIVEAKLQKKGAGGKWKNATRVNSTPYTPVILGRKYVGYTRDLKCESGHFRVHYRVAAYRNGKRINAPWNSTAPKKNPCEKK